MSPTAFEPSPSRRRSRAGAISPGLASLAVALLLVSISLVYWAIGAFALLGLILTCVGGWLLFAPGPRRRRAYGMARRLLKEGDWEAALEAARSFGDRKQLSILWKGRQRNVEGECHRIAGDAALKEGDYEACLEHYLDSAELLDLDVDEVRGRVVNSMLKEVRRAFAAATTAKEVAAIHDLIARLLKIQSPCAEASFWQGLCHVRAGRTEQALVALTTAYAQAGKNFLDPPLYLGALLLREGRPQEALRYLSEANRLDSNCPFVSWQLGTALLAANGDAGMAARALNRALGARGFSQWKKDPERAWVEAFPEAQSFVRRLASKHPFACPVMGSDLAVALRQAQVALAEAYSRLGNFQGAADVYAGLLQDSPPSASLLRGLGLALARLQRYDEAYKHLRSALEDEEPKTALTAGYLALCGALGKPTRPEDKARNVFWSIRLLAKFSVPGDLEWARLVSAVFAEARSAGLEQAAEDQARLCDVLVGVNATDPEAAAAYAHLAETQPGSLRHEYACLYARAAQQHGCTSDRDLDLFALLFREDAASRAFFAERGWDLDDVAYTYLERCAAQRPGKFPEELGPDYAPRGEQLLLERSRRLAESGSKEALGTAEVLLKLAPRSGPAHDWLARLHFREGKYDEAVALLAGWQRLEPDNHLPVVRQAVVEQRRGNAPARQRLLERALQQTRGTVRAAIACLGARLTLQEGKSPARADKGTNGTPAAPLPTFEPAALEVAEQLLQEALREDPESADALWQLAAVRCARGDQAGLAALSAAMVRPAVPDARFHYLAAVCHLAAGDQHRVLAACERAAAEPGLAAECQYLTGWACLHLNDTATAAAALQKAALAHGPSADHARALLGRIRFATGAFEEAIQRWQGVEPRKRQEWKVDEALRGTVFLSAIEAYGAGDYEKTADRLRDAGRLGCRDRRLGPLMTLALVKAGQRLLYDA